MNESKQKLRLEMKKVISQIHVDKFKEKERLIAHNLSLLILSLHKNTDSLFFQKTQIGGFAPIAGEEPEWRTYLNQFRLSYPAPLSKGKMVFRESKVDQLAPLVEFAGRIDGPALDALQVSPTLLIVPGLAFDCNGGRLGRGGGYYDRYLEKFNKYAIGICFSEQLVDSLDVDSWDKRVDAIVTDEKVLRFEKLNIWSNDE